jgi:hypothetical protein
VHHAIADNGIEQRGDAPDSGGIFLDGAGWRGLAYILGTKRLNFLEMR